MDQEIIVSCTPPQVAGKAKIVAMELLPERSRISWNGGKILVAVGPRMEIMDIVVRHPGSTHDSRIFDRSALRICFEDRQIKGLLLGDNGYPCRPYLLAPVIQLVHPRETTYYGAHIRTRNIVERVFGVWKRKFPCLRKNLTTKLEILVAFICATAVLYNIGIKQNDIAEDINDNIPNNLPDVIVNNAENN